MPSNRTSWGVDINRNDSVGSIFDGYDGASCELHRQHLRRACGSI